MTGRRESVGRLKARTQSASGPAQQEMVSVAVLPPRLRDGMAPPTGIGASGAMSWDESLNWQHNDKVQPEEVSRRKSLFRKAGITTQRQKRNPDLPPFVLRQIPYHTWRKHYAKDKDGNYHGTHAPAEDCLLKPPAILGPQQPDDRPSPMGSVSDDNTVMTCRSGALETPSPKLTSGRVEPEALPVYAEASSTPAVPEYEHDYDGPPRTPHPNLPADEDYLDADDDRLVSHVERQNSARSNQSYTPPRQSSYTAPRNDSIREESEENGKIIANGKTAKQIIEEAKASGGTKPTWKQMASKGVQMASFGTSAPSSWG